MTEPAAPRFSVVVPTYERLGLLSRALASLWRQTWTDFEVVVVDDASGAETADWIRRIEEPRLRSVRHDENQGIAAARNSGILAARGELIAFLDDDDEYVPTFLERSAAAMRDPEVGWCWCGALHLDDRRPDREPRPDLWTPRYESLQAAAKGFLGHRRIGMSHGLVVRRSCFRDIGLFDERFRSAEDTDLLVRLAGRYRFKTIDEYLLIIHHHSGPRLRQVSAENAQSYDRLIAKHADLMERDAGLARRLHYKAAWLHYHSSDYASARRHLFRLLRLSPFSLHAWGLSLLFETTRHHGARIHRFASRLRQAFRRNPSR